MRRQGLLALLALLLSPPLLSTPLGAQPLVADLTDHLIGITTGFTGTSVVLFGSTDGTGDVVVVVRGPTREMVVRRKSRVGFIWINTREATFTEVPSFYAIASSRPMGDITTPTMRGLHQLGLDNLRFGTSGRVRGDISDFRAALIRTQQREALFADTVGKVDFRGDRLFRTTVQFPSNVPTGTYLVEVFLIRDKEVVSGQTTPLVISKVGVDAEIYEFADRRSALYGIVAVFGAMMAGWLASLLFRSA
jgi:uncharacterized protein (TIGR02186 family)